MNPLHHHHVMSEAGWCKAYQPWSSSSLVDAWDARMMTLFTDLFLVVCPFTDQQCSLGNGNSLDALVRIMIMIISDGTAGNATQVDYYGNGYLNRVLDAGGHGHVSVAEALISWVDLIPLGGYINEL